MNTFDAIRSRGTNRQTNNTSVDDEWDLIGSCDVSAVVTDSESEWTHVDVLKPEKIHHPKKQGSVASNLKKAMDKRVKDFKSSQINLPKPLKKIRLDSLTCDHTTRRGYAIGLVGMIVLISTGAFVESTFLSKPEIVKTNAPHLSILKQNSSVLELNDKSFKTLLTAGTNDLFVYYYAKWCGHGRPISELKQVAMHFAGTDMIISKFEIVDKKKQSEDINAFPQLMFYPKKASRELASRVFVRRNVTALGGVRYLGDRSSRDMIQWIRRQRLILDLKDDVSID